MAVYATRVACIKRMIATLLKGIKRPREPSLNPQKDTVMSLSRN